MVPPPAQAAVALDNARWTESLEQKVEPLVEPHAAKDA